MREKFHIGLACILQTFITADTSPFSRLTAAVAEKNPSLSSYSYTRVRNVSSVFGDKVSFGISNAVLLQAPVKIVPFIYIYFVAHLICASSAEIKAAKSHNCIIDRAGHHLSPLDNCIARTEK